jgi:uncharacterized protein
VIIKPNPPSHTNGQVREAVPPKIRTMTSNSSSSAAGSVTTLWRYPVKSMQGEELSSASITDNGILGDRVYALIDQTTGKVASAKHPHKWGRLIDCHANFMGSPQTDQPFPAVQITFPDGTIATSTQEHVHALLSSLVERQVTLTTTRPASPSLERIDALDPAEPILDIGDFMMRDKFADYAAVHLVSTATLKRLQTLYPEGQFKAQRFRPNIVLETDTSQDFIEHTWVGRTIAIGEEVRLSITDPCPRCVITTLAQPDLPQDFGILQTAAQHSQAIVPAFGGKLMPSVGVYAFVVQGGKICQGDLVRVSE